MTGLLLFFILIHRIGDESLYRHNFTDDDFGRLRNCLEHLKGRFVLSIDDNEQVRALFGQWRMEEVELHYTSQTRAGRRYRELLITNFVPNKHAVKLDSESVKKKSQTVTGLAQSDADASSDAIV